MRQCDFYRLFRNHMFLGTSDAITLLNVDVFDPGGRVENDHGLAWVHLC
jgi:hypothetical protein